MNQDAQAIRQLIDTWMTASKNGDTKKVLRLMTDDVLFMTPDQVPFGKETFKNTSEKMKDLKIEGISEIKELQILGNWAYLRNFLNLKITSPDGKIISKKGYTLTLLKKEKGKWLLHRDANLLTTNS